LVCAELNSANKRGFIILFRREPHGWASKS
jgi:hypothetical protein